jgi:hypothetical protein
MGAVDALLCRAARLRWMNMAAHHRFEIIFSRSCKVNCGQTNCDGMCPTVRSILWSIGMLVAYLRSLYWKLNMSYLCVCSLQALRELGAGKKSVKVAPTLKHKGHSKIICIFYVGQ